jgi:hypothetical protein
VWARLQADATRELLDARYEPVSESAAREALRNRPLGVSRLRLLPKNGGMRPTINLGCPPVVRVRGGEPAAGGAGGAGGAAAGRKRRGEAARRQGLTLQFKPVNFVLQSTYHVRLMRACLAAAPSRTDCPSRPPAPGHPCC